MFPCGHRPYYQIKKISIQQKDERISKDIRWDCAAIGIVVSEAIEQLWIDVSPLLTGEDNKFVGAQDAH